MHAAQIGKYYSPVKGGIESCTQTLAEGLSSYDINSDVYVLNTNNSYQEDKINSLRVFRMARVLNLWSNPVAKWRINQINLLHYDLLHFHLPHPQVNFLQSKFCGKRIVTVHADFVKNNFVSLFYRIWLRWTLKKYDHVIVTSQIVRERLKLGLAKCSVIPLGSEDFNLKATRYLNKLSEAQKVNYESELIFVGRLVGYKGLEVLINAIKDVPSCRLNIIGSGPLEKKLKKIIKGYPLIQILSVDNQDQLAAYIACSKIAILPSVTPAEAFGCFQIEAMSCSRPVICFNLDSGVIEVNKHMKTGLVVDSVGSVSGLKKVIVGLLGDNCLYNKLSRGAREYYLERFTVEHFLDQHAMLYSEVLKDNQRQFSYSPHSKV